MSKKKTMSKTKKNAMKSKTKNVSEYEIKDIDAMIEDMKNLALEKSEEKEETKSKVVKHEDVKDEEIVNYLNESKDNVVISTDENVIFTNKEEEESSTGPLVKCEFDEEGNLINEDEINAMAKGEIKEETEEESTKEENENEVIEETEIGNIDSEIGPKEPIILNSKEDFDKVYKEEKPIEEKPIEEEKKEESKKENKAKRKSYEEMFGHNWMGYGYSNEY